MEFELPRMSSQPIGGSASPVTKERFTVRVEEGSAEVFGPRAGATQVVRAGEECVFDLASHSLQADDGGEVEGSRQLVNRRSPRRARFRG